MRTSYAPTRKRLSPEERKAQDQAALGSIVGNPSMSNFGQVILEFNARGIPMDQIDPKGNVFTYKAWRALGRQVRSGEKAVKITTWHGTEAKPDPETGELTGGRKICTTACVFHISQTDPFES